MKDVSEPEKNFDRFLDLLEKLPPIRLGRNDPCPWESGKKYKYCCLRKKSTSPSPETRLEFFQIKTDGLTSEEAQNHFENISEEDDDAFSTSKCDNCRLWSALIEDLYGCAKL